MLQTVKTVVKAKQNENIPPPAPVVKKVTTRSTLKQVAQCPGHTVLKAKDTNKENVAVPVAPNTKKRLSVEFEKSDESLYSTALEERLVETLKLGVNTHISILVTIR